MGKKNFKKYKKVGIISSAVLFLAFVAAVLITVSPYVNLPFSVPTWNDIAAKAGVTSALSDDARSSVHFIDCWQGDSELIQSDGKTVLIDAGPKKYGGSVVEYLKRAGIKKIDHFILTHPHEDHIGGAVQVLNNFEVEKIYMKKPADGKEPTSKVYRDLLNKISDKKLKVTDPKPASRFTAGKFTVEFLGPLKEYEETNDESIVLKATDNEISFLFTGDAESDSEQDMMEKYGDQLAAQVLKTGHHGSKTSSTDAFIKHVNPKHAVISCGLDNSYGHPAGQTLKTFGKRGVKVWRTDLNGDIVCKTDGKSVSFETEKE